MDNPVEKLVLDNSINSRLLWPDSESPENNEYALKVIQLAATGVSFHVPTIWHYEVAQVVSSLVKRREVNQADAETYLKKLGDLPVVTDVESHSGCTGPTLSLSIQYNLSVYAAAYLELALRLGVGLASNDSRLSSAALACGVPLYPR